MDVSRRVAGRLIATARYRSGGRCRLNKDQIARRISAGRCEVTNERFNLEVHELRPSLDRIDVDGPYRTSNILVTTWFFNRARGRLPLNEAVRLLKRSGRNASDPITG